MAKIGDLIIGIGANLKGLSRSLKQAERRLSMSARKLGRIGDQMSIGVSLPILGAGVAAVKAAADFESLETRLSVLTGSAKKGREEFEKLSEFSSKTPFRIDDIVKADAMLLAAGLSADKARESLKMLGDIAAVTGTDLSGLTMILAQAKSIGAAYTMDLRQLANRGIPVFDLLKKHLNITGEELQQFVSDGKVSFELLSEVLQNATKDGGMYKDGMLAASKTINGQFSTLADNMKIAMGQIGKAIVENIDLKGMIDKMTKSIISAVEWWGRLSPAVKKAGVIFAGVLAAIGPLFKAFSVLKTSLSALTVVFGLLTSPITLVVLAIGALAAGFTYAYNNSIGFRSALAGIWAVLKELGKAAKVAFFTLTGQFGKAAEAASQLNLNLKQVFRDAQQQAKVTKLEPVVIFDKKKLIGEWQSAVGGTDFTVPASADVSGGSDGSGSGKKKKHAAIQQLQSIGQQAQLTASEIADALEPVGPQIEEAFAPALQATEERVVALSSSMMGMVGAASSELLPLMGTSFEEMGIRVTTVLDDIRLKMLELSDGALVKNVWEAMGDAATQAGKAMMESAKRGVTSFKELGKAALSAAADVLRAKIIEGVASVVADALKKFGIAGLLIGSALGAAAGALFSSVVGRITTPKLASGGLAMGPTLAVVGDNPGARVNPEVIAPLDKLQNMMRSGTQEVRVSGMFRISGKDLVLALDEARQTDSLLF